MKCCLLRAGKAAKPVRLFVRLFALIYLCAVYSRKNASIYHKTQLHLKLSVNNQLAVEFMQ